MRHGLLLFVVFLCLSIAGGCNRSVDSIIANSGTSDAADQFSLSTETSGRLPIKISAASQDVYGSKVERILSADKSNYDYLVTFYLPYNPGSATFQGRTPWGWRTYAGSSAWVYDARPTSAGFRVIIRTTFSVVWWCSTAPGSYRLQF